MLICILYICSLNYKANYLDYITSYLNYKTSYLNYKTTLNENKSKPFSGHRA